MSDLLTFANGNGWIIALTASVAGYLIGSISSARLVYYLVTGSTNYEAFKEPVPHSDEVFESDLISATWVTLKLGKRYGCITSLTDMLKVALPTLFFKLAFPGQPYFLLAAISGIAGHNFPVYHHFVGGRGESPIIGALLIINWYGILIANGLAMILGYMTGSILVIRWGGYILMIFWFWYHFHNGYYVIFIILANFLFWISMRNDLAKYLDLKKTKGIKFNEEDVSGFILMGKRTGRFLDRYGLFQVLKRILK